MTPRVPGDKRRSDSKLQIANPILLASNHSIPSCHGTTEKRRRFKRNSRTNKHKTVMNNWRREIKGRHWLRHRKPWQRTYYSESEKKEKKIRCLKRERSLIFFLLCLLKCQRPVGNDGGETVKYFLLWYSSTSHTEVWVWKHGTVAYTAIFWSHNIKTVSVNNMYNLPEGQDYNPGLL